ncbi:hypothetical protein P4U03_30080 [Bacillus mycoides]|uniref:Uncharacterized protein n=8 Tax=root TaxID=1 RepID=A0A068EPW5_9CAUD|nr:MULTISPECIES: hypothetical protein [Bacillus cereus group]YP_009099285.1 hypothetical protein Waukesha92_20 [Bacillus phage Waukesha92]ALO79898.1 hypothetical protein XO29_0056 [Bacillus phage phiS58]AID50209.1 hypothetical protein Waukesha92_20 [Bacillus phage Waukesha92]AIE36855.1 hypothetical protein BTK_34791 [Bacillus thuringiensis serovar kurstaki str. HD-1]AJA23828.1 hypothetical protein BT4G5_34080 [Bacillus thuringiensis serovar galleriae]AJK44407.1 hypothetical protein BG08_6967 
MKSSYEYYVTPEDYEVAAKHGVSRKLLEHRIRNLGWDKDFAMTESPRKASEWSKVKEIALKNNIGRTTFKGRRKRGWSLIDSITKPPLSREETLKRANECNRVLTDEQIQKAKENGLRYSTVYDRIKKLKWNIEEALTTPALSTKERMRRLKENSCWIRL